MGDIPLSALLGRAILFFLSFGAVGFFAAVETAFLSRDEWAILGLRVNKDKKAALVSALGDDSRNTTSALLIGTNVFTVLTSVMGASIASLLGLGSASSLLILSLAITVVMFFFQLVPKTWAASAPTEIVLAVAPALAFLVRVLRPLSMALSVGPYLLARLFRSRQSAPSVVTDDPMRLAVSMAREEGNVDSEERDVIVGVLDSSDTKVRDVMVPFDEAFTLRPDTTILGAFDEIKKKRYSRIPVVGEDGAVLGVVYTKDVLRRALSEHNRDGTVRDIMRNPLIVSPDAGVLDVLAPMREDRVHLAVVVLEGIPVGIVTMDDIIQEIVGDIPASRGPAPRQGATGTVATGGDGQVESDGFLQTVFGDVS